MQITISERCFKKLQIEPVEQIPVKAGMITIYSRLSVRRDQNQLFKLSPALAKALHVKGDNHMQIRYDHKNNLLQIGPFIGILVNALPLKSEYDPTSLKAELIFLSNVGMKMAAEVYIFTPGGIDWETNTTLGYVYKKVTNHNGIWAESRYPLPDVVYDRIPSRSLEARENIKATRRKLMKSEDLKYFNPSYLNKWKVHVLLSENKELHPYLPETKQLDLDTLTEMLGRHKVVYIKPSNGSQGLGIIKAWQNKASGFINAIGGSTRAHFEADNPAELLKKTESIVKNRPYIVQKGINLMKYQNANFDIRIIYQKDGQGQWTISKKFVRIAAPGSSISNLSRGGRIERSVVVLKQLFKFDQKLIEAKNLEMRKLCEMIAFTLESASESTFGELGLDIGIDKTGHLWLIEVNSKPRKTTQTKMSQKIVYNTFSRPLEYAVYLAGFGHKTN